MNQSGSSLRTEEDFEDEEGYGSYDGSYNENKSAKSRGAERYASEMTENNGNNFPN
jgi:hypothetical protein